jgi:hypothetical protein
VITDLTTGTGRFNLVRGALGTLIAIAASISTTATGFLFEALGNWKGFLILAAASVIATALLWVAMPETRPAPCRQRPAHTDTHQDFTTAPILILVLPHFFS